MGRGMGRSGERAAGGALEIVCFWFAQIVAHRMRLVLPDEQAKENWDWLVILFVIYNALQVPFDLAFSPPMPVAFTVFDYLVDATFIVDMFISSRTTYYDFDMTLVLDYQLVRRHYMRTWFFPDLIATIPYEVFFRISGADVGEASLLGLAKLPRLLRLGRCAPPRRRRTGC